MPETRVKVYRTAEEYKQDRGLATRQGWEMAASTEQPDGTLKVWYRLTGAPPDSWNDHPPQDFSWQRLLAIVGALTVALLLGLLAVWGVARWMS